MVSERMSVGVIVERLPAATRWASHVWRAVEVLPGAPAAPAWTVLAEGGGTTRFFAGVAELVVHSGETEPLAHNLGAAVPSVWVVLRRADTAPGWRLLLATVDAGEAHAHADTGDDLVEMVAMPDAVRAWLEPFVARHHVERQRHKRRRDRADPEALAVGRRGRGEDG